MTDKKRCKYCDSEIGVNAIYCANCNHYQNWRKYVNFGNSFLALTIALITVLTAFLPILKETFEEEKSLLTVSFLESTHDGFLILVTNEGNQRGVVADTRLKLNLGDDNDGYLFETLRNTSNNRIIEPKKAVEFLLIPPKSDNSEFDEFKYVLRHMHDDGTGLPQTAAMKRNFLVIGLINHDGTKENVEIEIPKQEFSEWLDNIFPERKIPRPPLSP